MVHAFKPLSGSCLKLSCSTVLLAISLVKAPGKPDYLLFLCLDPISQVPLGKHGKTKQRGGITDSWSPASLSLQHCLEIPSFPLVALFCSSQLLCQTLSTFCRLFPSLHLSVLSEDNRQPCFLL